MDMTQFIIWYFLITFLGLAIFPITRRLFSKGVAQGFFFSRVIALFIWGFIYWFLGSIKIIPVNLSGAVLVLIFIFGGVFALSSKSFKTEYLDPLREHKKAVITGEILFLAAFLFMALLKSMSPNLDHTETPMEMAFINAILRSDTFPPRDPWLSGYAISYYYFGYVIVSLLIRVSGADPAVGFTLAVSLWYGLSAQVIYGIMVQFLSDWRIRIHGQEAAMRWNRARGSFLALLAPVLTLFSGNMEGLLEIFYARGWFWQKQADGSLTSAFWTWLDITDLKTTPLTPVSWMPNRSGWWWWQGSRVLGDYDIAGNFKEIIDEFPFFSYFLGDLHPHVLAMPFVLVAVALSYMLFLRLKEYQPSPSIYQDVRTFFSLKENLSFTCFTLVFIGGIAFLNTWDFPIYFGLFLMVFFLWRIQGLGWSSRRLQEMIYCGLICGFVSLIFYLPFFLSFSSQAGGLLPSLIYFTTGKQLWIFFGAFLVPIFIWLIWQSSQHGTIQTRFKGFMISLGSWLVVGLFAMLIAGIGLALINTFVSDSELLNLGSKIYNAQGYGTTHDILLETILRRVASPFGWITLVVLFGLVISLFCRRPVEEKRAPIQFSHESGFLVLVLSIAAGLIAFPEFFYLLDNFGWPINTIFKFYYQAWLLLSICASFAIIVIFDQLKSFWKHIARSLIIVVLAVAMVYPVTASIYRFTVEHNQTMSLDGAYHLRNYSPDEMEAIDWLKTAPDGIVVEAIGGSYRAEFGKVSTHSGLPTVLGWPGHEGQWRGGSTEIGSREEDVRRIYQVRDWNEARLMLDQYHVRYIYIGSVERYTYQVEEAKFIKNLDIAFQNTSVVIYEYNPAVIWNN
jgi:YYY domain-containing protein